MPEVLKTWSEGIMEIPYVSSNEKDMRNLEKSADPTGVDVLAGSSRVHPTLCREESQVSACGARDGNVACGTSIAGRHGRGTDCGSSTERTALGPAHSADEPLLDNIVDTDKLIFDDFDDIAEKFKLNLEFNYGYCWHIIEHGEPRSSLYAPECGPLPVPDAAGEMVIMPVEAYTGERVTIGRYRDTGDVFHEFIPWAMHREDGGIAEGQPLSESMSNFDQSSRNMRPWTGKTMLQLSNLGEAMAIEWNQSGKSGFRCSLEGCEERAFRTCPQKCSTRLLCSRHLGPAYHSCGGRQAVLVEDCSEDYHFVLHFPQDGEGAEILPQITLADKAATALPSVLGDVAGSSAGHPKDERNAASNSDADVLWKLAASSLTGSSTNGQDSDKFPLEGAYATQ